MEGREERRCLSIKGRVVNSEFLPHPFPFSHTEEGILQTGFPSLRGRGVRGEDDLLDDTNISNTRFRQLLRLISRCQLVNELVNVAFHHGGQVVN